MASRRIDPWVLDRDKLRVIRLQAGVVRAGDFFLAGGTGLGIRLGHRVSQDLDWFTATRFDAVKLQEALNGLPESPTKIERHGRHTVRAYYGLLETSFISYEQVPAKPDSVAVAGTRIRVADIDVMAAMKAAAVHDRGARRDFIDIHAICGEPGWSVGRFIEHAARLLPLAPAQVARALIYYADADKQPMPAGYSVPWKEVKVDLTKGVREWEAKGPGKSGR